MPKTKSTALDRRHKFGKVTLCLSLPTGELAWVPADGYTQLTKEERQLACKVILDDASANGLLPCQPNSDGTHPEENIIIVWNKLFSGINK